jgi:hypothetical protein
MALTMLGYATSMLLALILKADMDKKKLPHTSLLE